jgi:hypothetical protein
MEGSAFQPGLGHNSPPVTIGDELRERHADLLKRADEALLAAANAPAEINDDSTEGKVGELVKILRKTELALEAEKKKEVEPHQNTVDKVRGFFTEIAARLEKVRLPLKKKSEDYLLRKAEAEKKRLAEEEADRREKARIALMNAENAERDKTSLAREAAEAQRLSEDAHAAKESAQTDQEIAAADLAQAKAELSRAKTVVLEFASERSIKVRDGIAIDEVDFATRKQSAEAGVATARNKVSGCEDLLRQAREKARAAKAEQDRLAAEVVAANRKEREAAADVKSHMTEAVRHDNAANRIEAKIEGKPADLVRNHSEHGATSTLSREWFYEVTDADRLDAVKLWPFVDGEAKRIAFGKWARSQEPQNRVMAGGRAYQENVGQIR